MAYSALMVLAALNALAGDGTDGAATAAREAAAPAAGLANMSAALNGTGRIAPMHLRSNGVDAGSGLSQRDDVVVRPAAAQPDRGEAPPSAAVEAMVDTEFGKAGQTLDACRIEVARRRKVPPSSVSAGDVTLRWTIEPDGRVRDAEARAATDTDLEVAACAKRVISGWVFVKQQAGPVTVQRTHAFR